MRIRLYLTAVRYQLLSLFRLPAYWIPTLLFPVMLFAMFGSGGSGQAADYRMASFVVYGVIGVAFFQFGVSIAQERESHWERYRRSLPGAGGPHLVSQLLSALLFSLLSAAMVVLGAFVFSAPTVGLDRIVMLLVVSLAVAVPFTLLGIALGYWTTPKSTVCGCQSDLSADSLSRRDCGCRLIDCQRALLIFHCLHRRVMPGRSPGPLSVSGHCRTPASSGCSDFH